MVQAVLGIESGGILLNDNLRCEVLVFGRELKQIHSVR